MAGYRSMKRRAWRASSPPNTGESGGGRVEEEELVKEDLLESLRAGPEPLEATHDTRVGGVAHGVHFAWGVRVLQT
jgi:hypothetical protein